MAKTYGKLTLSLTGKDSHKVNITPGQGSFSIAPKTFGEKADAYVDADTPILWEVFNDFKVPAGGNWPRAMDYVGNDTRFIEWTERREAESFHWTLMAPATVDFSKAKIEYLLVDNNDYPLDIKLGNKWLKGLSLQGNPHKITLESAVPLKSISFDISTEKKNNTPVFLPKFEVLKDLTTINISTPVGGQPFDCGSLLQFKKLKTVRLNGNMCNMEALGKLNLSGIEVRYCPDMSGLPPLSTWADFSYCIFWNVEEVRGKVLRKELKELEKTRELSEYASVSNLHPKSWFATEFNIPFASWEGKNGREAMKAYKETLKAVKKAKEEKEVRSLLEALIAVINGLPNIETTEREDAYEAVCQLAEVAPFEIDEEKIQLWFDQAREF